MSIRKKSLLIFLFILVTSNYLFFLLTYTLTSFSRYNAMTEQLAGEISRLQEQGKELEGEGEWDRLNQHKADFIHRLKYLSIPVFIIIHIFIVVLFVFSRQKVINPLEELEESARLFDQSSSGDFPLPVLGNDEISSLARSIRKMVGIIDNQRRWLDRNLENMDDGIISLDRNGRISYMNKRAQEMTGWPFSDASGLPHDEVISLKDVLSIEGGENCSQKTLLYPLGGNRLDVEIRWYGIENELGTLLVIRDISGELKRQRELEKLQSRMNQRSKLSSIGLMAAGMAHEINNPIGFIQSNQRFFHKSLERIKEEMGENLTESLASRFDELIKINEANQAGIERIGEIVKGVNSFSRERQDSPPAEHDINELVGRTLEIVRNRSEKKAIIHRELNALPKTICFAHQIEQVLMNLLINAIQAADGDHPEIFLTTSCRENMITCSVEDNGPGVSGKIAEKIFDPFYTTKKQGEGTGLGLYVSYNIIRKYGGDIRVGKSRWGGAEFIFYIPVQQKNVI